MRKLFQVSVVLFLRLHGHRRVVVCLENVTFGEKEMQGKVFLSGVHVCT